VDELNDNGISRFPGSQQRNGSGEAVVQKFKGTAEGTSSSC
jgi:hypothetical protein